MAVCFVPAFAASARFNAHRFIVAAGMHSQQTETIGDLHMTLADEIMGAGIGQFSTASRKISEL